MNIRAIRIPVVSGYAHASVITRPWIALVDEKPLPNRVGQHRRFATEGAALRAARKAARQLED